MADSSTKMATGNDKAAEDESQTTTKSSVNDTNVSVQTREPGDGKESGGNEPVYSGAQFAVVGKENRGDKMASSSDKTSGKLNLAENLKNPQGVADNANGNEEDHCDISHAAGNDFTVDVCAGTSGISAEVETEVVPPQTLDEGGRQSLYHIKWTKWKGINTAIITQNENGPCPLIAITNALILQRKISIPSMQEIISANQLMEYLGDCILDQAPEKLPEGAQLNYEQNMHDAIGIFSKLQTGLDVNVKFTGVADFEFTRECIVFDLFNIRLLHGWLVDPQNHEAVKAINNLSYNQLVEKIIASKQEGADTGLVTEGIIAEAFLEQSASQLTYHGLYELSTQTAEEEPCVFFRNNHFNTLFKHKNELFLLVTDQGFLTEDKVMWETLSNVEGDGYFVDANFRTLPTSQPAVESSVTPSLPPAAGISQEDQDYLIALTLQEEQAKTEARDREAMEGGVTNQAQSTVPQQNLPPPSAEMSTQEWSDMQLALQLQEEERQQQQHQPHQQQARPVNVPREPPSHATPSEQQPRPQDLPQQSGPQLSNEKCNIL